MMRDMFFMRPFESASRVQCRSHSLCSLALGLKLGRVGVPTVERVQRLRSLRASQPFESVSLGLGGFPARSPDCDHLGQVFLKSHHKNILEST